MHVSVETAGAEEGQKTKVKRQKQDYFKQRPAIKYILIHQIISL
jgi:hypothetical protein